MRRRPTVGPTEAVARDGVSLERCAVDRDSAREAVRRREKVVKVSDVVGAGQGVLRRVAGSGPWEGHNKQDRGGRSGSPQSSRNDQTSPAQRPFLRGHSVGTRGTYRISGVVERGLAPLCLLWFSLRGSLAGPRRVSASQPPAPAGPISHRWPKPGKAPTKMQIEL